MEPKEILRRSNVCFHPIHSMAEINSVPTLTELTRKPEGLPYILQTKQKGFYEEKDSSDYGCCR